MADCPEADRWRPLYQMAAVRREVLKRLQASVDAHDDAGMVQWGSKRCLANYPLPQPLAEAIAAARERLGPQRIAADRAGQCGRGKRRRRNAADGDAPDRACTAGESGDHRSDES